MSLYINKQTTRQLPINSIQIKKKKDKTYPDDTYKNTLRKNT